MTSILNILSAIVYFIIILLPFGNCDMTTLSYPKNPAQPPGAVFGLVWGTLYILMTISFYLIVSAPSSWMKIAAIAFALIGLLMNKLWTPLWCAGRAKDAFLLFIGYLMVIALQLFTAYTVNPIAGILIAPLFVWGIVAIDLNRWTVQQIGIKE
jgi:tryptophan-rich sensory protein